MRKGSSSWFDALVARFFYEASAEEGGVDLQHCMYIVLPSTPRQSYIAPCVRPMPQMLDSKSLQQN